MFDAFLSYSTRGDYWASRRAEAFLEGFHVILARGGVEVPRLRVCRDGSDFRQVFGRANEDAVWARIQASIDDSRRLLVMCSPESAMSAWVDREVRWAIEKNMEVWLIVMAGDAPASAPEGIIPPAAIEARLHTNHIWYDLRNWRGLRGALVRDAEDELVRLARDLVGPALDGTRDVATIWQRETLRQRRRVLNAGLIMSGLVIVGAVLAAWQFQTARERADEARSSADGAHAASITRIADAQIESSPLQAALALVGIDPDHAPADALDVGYRMLARDIPAARLRGHRSRIIAGAVDSDGRVVTIDARGTVFAGSADDYRQRLEPGDKTVHAIVAPGGRVWMRAYERGEVRRSDDATGCVSSDGFQPRAIVPSTSFEQALVIGFSSSAWWCDFETHRDHRLAVAHDIVTAWVDRSDARSWLLVSSDGELWRVNIADGVVREIVSPTASKLLRDAGLVGTAVDGPGGRFAVVAGDRLFVGQLTTTSFDVHELPIKKPVALQFSPTGDRLAVATADGVVAIVGQGDKIAQQLDHRIVFFRLDIDAHDKNETDTLTIRGLAWAPDGRTLATLQAGFGIRVWGTDPDRPAEPRLLRGHGAAELLAWSPDGSWLATFGDGEVQLWHGTNPQQVQVLDRLSTAALVDETTLLVGTVPGRIRVYADGRLDRDPVVLDASESCGDHKASQRVEVLHDEPQLGFWSAHADGRVTLWDRHNHPDTSQCTGGTAFAYDRRLHGILLVDGTHHLALVDRSGVRVLDATPLPSAVSVLSTSRDGRWIAAGTSTGRVIRWDVEATSLSRVERRPHLARVSCLDVEEDTGEVLSGAEDATATIDDFARGQPVSRWSGDNSWIESCAVTPTRGVMGSSNGRAWVLPRALYGVALPLRTRLGVAHAGPTDPVALRESEDLAITAGSYDGYVRVWSLTTRQMIGQAWLETPIVGVVDAGPGIYAVAEGGIIRYLPLHFEGIQSALRARTSSELTAGERALAFGEPADLSDARYAWSELVHGRQPIPANAEYDADF